MESSRELCRASQPIGAGPRFEGARLRKRMSKYITPQPRISSGGAKKSRRAAHDCSHVQWQVSYRGSSSLGTTERNKAAFCDKEGGVLEKRDIDDKILTPLNKKRSDVVKGTLSPFPAGKTMQKIKWNCELEKKAKTALETVAPATCLAGPTAPADNAAIYHTDAAGAALDVLVQGMLGKVDTLAKATDFDENNGNVVVVAPNGAMDLIRSDTTEIGCAVKECDDDATPAVKHSNVYCLTNQKALAKDDSIYPLSGGGCKADADCAADKNETCDTTLGLCEVPETTAVLPKGKNTLCSKNEGMTDALRTQFLDMHNYRRSILAKGQVQRPSGNYLPTGANIIKLKTNCTMEKEAIEEVRDCPTLKEAHGTYGKNFDRFSSSTAIRNYEDAVKKAVTNWWKVVRTDNTGPGMQVTFRDNHVGTPVETYAQIAWADTKEIGCAIANCSSAYTVICLYSPKGNIPDQVLYKTGKTCSACPSGTKCDSGLGLCV
ncbi:unnamed protein product [Cylicocyclus nassatus]|uniref:SCP domain-containing protein n=1 Tax=Cylicocyclus nassatus TaxID=53992 RepID=A0AA36H1X2_CYLNA|nr:unnamed protein product [Cylicocyclus nassatus]